jgi:hypothetical protein
MRLAQVLLTDLNLYEQKCQRLDAAALASTHEVIQIAVDSTRSNLGPIPGKRLLRALHASQCDVAHIYGSALPPAIARRLDVPFVATELATSRPFWWSGKRVASRAMPPAGPGAIAEPVDDEFLHPPARPRHDGEWIVGSVGPHRPDIRRMLELTLTRIHRFREDLSWHLLDEAPTPEDLAAVDIWVDPAADDGDADGYTAEAMVAGLPVIASRTAVNRFRTDDGRAAVLVPPGDPNELTHAILTALFKPETIAGRLAAARELQPRFSPARRAETLSAVYRELKLT